MLSAPLFSHADWGGYLKTAQALRDMGHKVLWVSGQALANPIKAAELEFAQVRQTGWLWPPPPAPDLTTLKPAEAVMLRYRRALDTWLSEELVGEAVQAILELADEIGKPDVIVTDPFLSAAAIVAEKLDVPLAVCGWIAQRELNEDDLFPVQKSLAHESQGRIQRLCERYHVQGVNFSQGATPSILSPHLHISYFCETWYQADVPSLLDQTVFVGGQPSNPTDAPPEWLTAIPNDVPLALITLGTTFAGDLGFFSWSAQAAARGGYLPIVTIGYHPYTPEQKDQLVKALPRGTRLLNFAPFDHLLPRVKLMLHHGGMGTTHAAVIHGIPQIVVPHAADQRGQARRAAQAKVGLNLTAHDVRQGKLLEATLALKSNDQVQANAKALATEMASLGGAQAAAEALVELGAQYAN